LKKGDKGGFFKEEITCFETYMSLKEAKANENIIARNEIPHLSLRG
jgi:hypothetical protein